MGQFFKFMFASCLGVFIAIGVIFLILIMIAYGATEAGKSVTIEDNSVLDLSIDYNVPELTNNVSEGSFKLQQEDIVGLRDILEMVRAAKDDPNIRGIYLNPSSTNIGPVKTAELASALADFKTSGKWVLSYAEYYSQGGFALAAQADTVMLNPIGSVDFRGYAALIPFFKELMDKIGLKMQIYYAGEYKSATEPFRRTDMSPENRLQTHEYLNDVYGRYLESIGKGRDIDPSRLYEIATTNQSQNADDALALGLVDMIAYKDQADAWMRTKLGLDAKDKIKLVTPADYRLGRKHTSNISSNRIAVVYAEGEIVPGEGDYGIISDKRYTKLLAEIRKNDKIKAVVLRINSPGGNILAAENILREVNLIKESGKPVVVSMSDYAASGGYYIAADADSIFAEPTTLTGSIGVFTMIPNVQELLNDKLGIRFDTVRTGEYSAGFTPFFEWSDGENMAMKVRTDEFYDIFLDHVSKARHMSKEEVHAIARGRIWSGDKAVQNGLVDRLGSLDDAIASAVALAHLKDYKISEYPRVLSPLNKLIAELSGQEVSVADKFLETKLEQRIPHYRDFKSLLSFSEPMARLPVIISF